MSSRKIGNITFTNINLLLILGGISMLFIYGYVFYMTYKSEKHLLSIMIIPLVLGVIFENRRLSSDWKTILLKILGSLFGAIFSFMPGKGEQNYNLENHIENWPYFFIFFFVTISVINHDKKLIPKLTEGITLLQSISIIYWIVDVGFFNFENIFSYVLVLMGLVFSIFSFIHAFSYIKLTRTSRLFLSIWSSIIMIIFAIDYIYKVFDFRQIVSNSFLDYTLNLLQYFLLGVSLMYIFQNAFMLMVYLPSKHRFYDEEHRNDIKKMNKTHIKRYSRQQIKVSNSLLALFFAASLYFINYEYRIMPRNALIWLVFWIFPYIVWFKEKMIFKKAINNR